MIMSSTSVMSQSILVVLLLLKYTCADWWNLGMMLKQYKLYGENYESWKDEVEFFANINTETSRHTHPNSLPNMTQLCQDRELLKSPTQRKICTDHPELVQSFARASELAMDTCTMQFMNSRWNCSLSIKGDLYGPVSKQRNRETAYLYALNSAATVYQIAKDCSSGLLGNCTCDNHSLSAAICSDFVDFAHHMSATFLDSQEYTRIRRRQIESNERRGHKWMNVFNNEVGRLIAVRLIKATLGCQDKPCVNTNTSMLHFSSVRHELFQKYKMAAKAEGADSDAKTKSIRSHFAAISAVDMLNLSNCTRAQLAFLEDSPDYCEHSRARLVDSKFLTFKVNETIPESLSDADLDAKCKDVCCEGKCQVQRKDTRFDCECTYRSTVSATDSGDLSMSDFAKLYKLAMANCVKCVRVNLKFVCN